MPKQKSTNKVINLILKKGFWYSRKINICLDDETFITLKRDTKTKITPKYYGLNIKIGGLFFGSEFLYGNYNIFNLENIRDIEFQQFIFSGETRCFVVYKNGQRQRIMNASNYSLLFLILTFALFAWF